MITPTASRLRYTCTCNAYGFPHRAGGGACSAPSLVCPECGSPEVYRVSRASRLFGGYQPISHHPAEIIRCDDCGHEEG